MRYEEALIYRVTKREAELEILRNNADPKKFFEEVGERDKYIGREVLEWLGYCDE